MLKLFLLCFCFLSFSQLQFVDPLIGTGGSGFGCGALNPDPQRPFAMVRLGPDTI